MINVLGDSYRNRPSTLTRGAFFLCKLHKNAIIYYKQFVNYVNRIQYPENGIIKERGEKGAVIMDIKKVGEALFALNKEAKKIRDCKTYEKGQYSVSLSKEECLKYSNKILAILNIDYDTYNQSERRILIEQIEKEEKKLYELKNLVIKKAKEKGIKPKGYHDFVCYHIDGTFDLMAAAYIEIGGYGFHYGLRSQIYYDLPFLGRIDGWIGSDCDIEYTKEMEDILKKYLEE